MREGKRGTQTQSSGVKRVQLPRSHPRGYKLCAGVWGRKQTFRGRAGLVDLVRYCAIFRILQVTRNVMRLESNLGENTVRISICLTVLSRKEQMRRLLGSKLDGYAT